mgnify:CR=1 FL=1
MGPALADATYALATRCTLEAASPFPWKHATARGRAAGAASFTKREGGGDPAEMYRAASLRWEYDAAQLRASVERGDGEWCMALYDAYEGWRAGNAESVYARAGGLAVLWTRHEDEETVLARLRTFVHNDYKLARLYLERLTAIRSALSASALFMQHQARAAAILRNSAA